MRTLIFAKRCAKDILRDPLNLIFGLGFPIALLLLLSAIQSNVPVELFKIEKLAPGIAVFGLSFITLFSATLVAKDRESAFLQRLYSTPLTASNFILGYTLPMILLAEIQGVICYLVAVILGLTPSISLLFAVLGLLPTALFYVALGLLCGSVFNVKQVGGICGALLTNLSAWLAGVWFDLELVGGAFVKIAKLLPFVHAVEIERAILNGEVLNVLPSFLIVTVYGIVVLIGAILLFVRQMKGD